MIVFPEGPRDMDDVLEIFKAKGYFIDREKYDEGMSDYIRIMDADEGRTILWNTFNYRFSVFDVRGERIATESSPLEDEAWYMDLLMTFFAGEPVEVDG